MDVDQAGGIEEEGESRLGYNKHARDERVNRPAMMSVCLSVRLSVYVQKDYVAANKKDDRRGQAHKRGNKLADRPGRIKGVLVYTVCPVFFVLPRQSVESSIQSGAPAARRVDQ